MKGKERIFLMLFTVLGSLAESISESPFPDNRFYDDNMCGVSNLELKKPEPPEEFSCPYMKPEVYKPDEDWPWLGVVTNTKTDQKFLGVVIAEDTIVTDSKLQETMTSPNGIKFELLEDQMPVIGETITRSKKAIFSSFVTSSSLKDTVFFLVLKEKIPKDLFRPICIPPLRYIEKMVKPTSCTGESMQTITKFELGHHEFMKTEEELFDEHSCSLSLLESSPCTAHFKQTFQEEDTLKPNNKFKRVIKNNKDYYTCHAGAIKAARECNLMEAEAEAKCRNVKKDQCLGFIASGDILLEDSLDDAQKQNRKCADKTSKEYTTCVVKEFEDAMNESSDRPYKGINCLHDFMEVSPCAVKKEKPGLMPLGSDWAFNPCQAVEDSLQRICDKYKIKKQKCFKHSKLKPRYDKCHNNPKNKYFKTQSPYKKYWSLSMLQSLLKFSDSIVKETNCDQCSEGPNICTKTDSPLQQNTPDFLFWFDSCRDKWFFLGIQSPIALDSNLPDNCAQPLVYSNMEGATQLMRVEIAGKVQSIDLYPKPVIVVLGPTGVGKSTTGNSLISGNTKNSQCFSSGSGTSSKTKVTAWKVGKWLGVGQCVTVVDTPGTDDTSGEYQDYENIKELTEFLKTDLKQIDVFLVMFKETSNRFVPSMSKAIDVFESIFGKSFWQNMATEFTFWDFSESAMKERYTKLCSEDFKSSDCQDLDSGSEGEELEVEEYDIPEIDFNFVDEQGNTQDLVLPDLKAPAETAIQADNELVCTLMKAKDDAKFNKLFFKDQNISSTDWKKLELEDNLDESNCRKENAQKFTKSMYEKADFVSRMIKKSKWSKEYETDVIIPYVFIHPVWNMNDNRQCEIFKRETSELLEIANKMQPFVCSEKCQAPKSFFAGKPMILDYIDQETAVHADFSRQSFQLSCTVWNGVSYSALRDEDVTWFHGWNIVEYKNKDRYHQTIERSHTNALNTNFITLKITGLSDKDVGLYDCTYPGIKEEHAISFSSAAQITADDIRHGSIELNCKVSHETEISPEQLIWNFANEIRRVSHFTKSLNKVTNQFAVSQLYMDFQKNTPQNFEGTYGCKTDEFSNQVDLLVNENAKWSTWSQWGKCSMPCQLESGVHGTQERNRRCIPPRNEGKSCEDIDGNAQEVDPCNIKCCPQNGSWSSWSGWGACRDQNTDISKTCSKKGEDPGHMKRSRTSFPPSCGGTIAEGVDTDIMNCNSFQASPCPIDGHWGQWEGWSSCEKDPTELCAGVETRRRKCDNPEPEFGGHSCVGSGKETSFCEPVCEVDCQCGDFTEWGQCTKHCGVCDEQETCVDGTKSRERHCTEEKNGGKSCTAIYGNRVENKPCIIPHCPVNAVATAWSGWSECHPNKGRQERTRSCREPKFGGKSCDMPVKEVRTCAVNCQCAGVEWGSWSPCSGTCGEGTREKNRVCKAHKNNGIACRENHPSVDFSSKVTEKCDNGMHCPIIVTGEWKNWGDWTPCSVKCGGGVKTRNRKCEYPGKSVQKEGEKAFDKDYDREKPCVGSGVEVIGGDGDENQCNKKSCEVSTLVYLMDTTGSFSGVDQNSALRLGKDLLEELKRDGVEVPSFRIVTIDDPKVEVRKIIANQNDFQTKLDNLYKENHPGGNNNWEEKSMDGILQAINAASHGAVICLFTDAASHDLGLEDEISRKITEKDIHLFIFLTPDYPLYAGEGDSYRQPTKGMESYRVYQKISSRHTYIMSKTEPSTAAIVMHKALKSSQKECVTYDGPTKWIDSPNECQFPFWYKGVEYKKCTSVEKTQPWCATIVKKEGDKHVHSDKGGENWWGYCGNCKAKGEVDKRCKSTGHKVLRDSWRTLKDGDSLSAKSKDDSNLAKGWYKFDVTGTKNDLPTFKHGIEPTKKCDIGGKYAQVELPSSGTLTEHDEDEKEFRFCFDASCYQFKMMEVLWCPPKVHNQEPFYIYNLKPTKPGMAYCV